MIIVSFNRKLQQKMVVDPWGHRLVSSLDREIIAVSTFPRSEVANRYEKAFNQWLKANNSWCNAIERRSAPPRWKRYMETTSLQQLARNFKPVRFRLGTVRATWLEGDYLFKFTMDHAEAVFHAVGYGQTTDDPNLQSLRVRILQSWPSQFMGLLEDKSGFGVRFQHSTGYTFRYGGRGKLVF